MIRVMNLLIRVGKVRSSGVKVSYKRVKLPNQVLLCFMLLIALIKDIRDFIRILHQEINRCCTFHKPFRLPECRSTATINL